MFDVRDFGAKGDGIVDDRLAIQAAIDAAAIGGGTGTVFIPAGTYIIGTPSLTTNQPLIIPSNIRLIGEGIGCTILRLPDNASQHAPWSSQIINDPLQAVNLATLLINRGNAWWFGTGKTPDFPLPEATEHIEIAYMTLDGNNFGQPIIYAPNNGGSVGKAAFISACCGFSQLSRAYLHDLELRKAADSALDLRAGLDTFESGITDSRFERLWIHHNGWASVSISGETRDLSFDDCVFEFNDNQAVTMTFT